MDKFGEKYKRLINFGWNVFKANYKDLKFPFKLNYALTYKCNQRCLTCNIWEKKVKDEMSIKDIDIFFRKNSNFNWIDLTGGEIFLRKDIHEILHSIVSNCPNLYLLHFPTNGSCGKEVVRAVDYLIKSSVPRIIVSVSIDGNEDVHNSIRGNENAFKLAAKTFHDLKKRTNKKINVYAGMTISDSNVHLVPDIFRKMEEEIPRLTYDDIHINFAQTSSHYYANNGKMLIKPYQQEKIFYGIANKTKKGAKGVIKYLEANYQSMLLKFLKDKVNPVVCQALSCSLFMDPGGNLYPCITWNNQLGNIIDHQYSLSLFLNNLKIKKTRKDIIKNKCPNCWTPCEAYQAIMARSSPLSCWR